MRIRVSLVCAVALLAACTMSKSSADSTNASAADTSNKATAANNDDAGRSAIDKIRAGWQDAASKKDSATIASYYTDDAVLATPGAPVANGKAAIEATIGRYVNMTSGQTIESKQLVVHGDDATDYGTYKETVKDPKGKSVDVDGYYIVMLHRGSDGNWKITHHVGVEPPRSH